MPQDLQIAKLSQAGLSYRQIADIFGLNVDGVRGRVGRVKRQQKEEMDAFVASTQIYTPVAHSVRRQFEIIERANEAFDGSQARLSHDSNLVKLMWISDIHIPYQDNRAVDLTVQLMDDFKPNYATSLNDLFDFKMYSTRWLDTRSAAARLWEEDIENAYTALSNLFSLFHGASPNTLHLGLLGNHDKRLFHYLRSKRDGTSESTVANFMSRLESIGILQFSNDEENVIKLSPGLKLVHGVSAASNPGTVAKKTIERLTGKSYDADQGVSYNVIYGHTHRAGSFRYNGVVGYNSGCIQSVNPDYLPYPADWDLGVVMGVYDPNSRYVHMDVVNYLYAPNGHLQCTYNNRSYIA